MNKATMVDDPSLIDLIRELRTEVGLFAGAMPITPKQAWEEAIEQVRRHKVALDRIVEEGRRVPLSRGEMFNIAREALGASDG